MSDTTPAQAEATGETVEFEHFGRKWHAPSAVRLSHQRSLLRHFRQGGNIDIALVDTFLSAEELAALEDVDPTTDELDKFTDALTEAMGLKSKGNS